MARARVLLAITVYDGRDFVPDCLESAARVAAASDADVSVIALDDASPAPGWSAECADICARLGIAYYRSPRNLGIVRNVNLGLLRAIAGRFDYCLISNSDVLYPATMVDQLVRVARADPTIGSVTAWSNNVSIYSVPNDEQPRLRDQGVVDAVTGALTAEFGDVAIDVPTGISFSMLISTDAARAVGLMDPVYGRGYCEEIDWSLRSVRAGYRLTVAPSVLVYHAGGGSTVAAGLVAKGATTVAANEAIIDWRYPEFRQTVRQFIDSGVCEGAWDRATRAIVAGAARRSGYRIEITSLPRPADDEAVRCVVAPGFGATSVEARWRGFAATFPVDAADPAGSVVQALGGEPLQVLRHAPDPVGDAMVARFTKAGVEVVDDYRYPECV